MFGEDIIIGKSTGKMDNKGRIFIPTFTHAEPKDKIVVQKVNIDNTTAIKLIAFQKYFKIIERLQNLRDKAASLKEFEKYDNEIEIICQNLNALLNIDKQRRIQIPIHLLNELNWEYSSEIQFEGLGESLLVRKK